MSKRFEIFHQTDGSHFMFDASRPFIVVEWYSLDGRQRATVRNRYATEKQAKRRLKDFLNFIYAEDNS